MALTAPVGLSTEQKRKLEQNDPLMSDSIGIPEAVATETDVNNVVADLASTAAGKGASCIGYEGGTTVQAQVAANTSAISALGGGGNTGFDAETAGAGGKMQLYEATANGTNKVTMASPASLAADRTITVPDADVPLTDLPAKASSNVGITRHIKVTTPGGATADTDTALPSGTWEVVDAWTVNKAAGTAGDTLQVKKGANAITEAASINVADKGVVRFGEIDDANNSLIGGTDTLRVTETDGGGADSPSVDVHVLLRLVA